MRKISVLSKVSMWVVNLMIVLVIAGGLYSYYSLIGFTGEGKRPESTEGVVHWESRHEINIGEYVLARVSEYSETEMGFSDYLELKVPYPRIYLINNESADWDLEIRPKEGSWYSVSQSGEIYLPLSYRFNEESKQTKIIILFVVLLTLSLAVSLYILIVLRGFLASLARGEFFTRLNSRRLVILGAASFLIPLMASVGRSISQSFFIDNFQVLNGGLDLTRYSNPSPVIFGIIFLLMAGVVYEGSKLKEETDLTI